MPHFCVLRRYSVLAGALSKLFDLNVLQNLLIQVLHQQIRGEGVKTCADLLIQGVGVQNLGKPTDVIHERSLRVNDSFGLGF